VCPEFVLIKVILAIKTVKSNRHPDPRRCAASRRIVVADPPRTKSGLMPCKKWIVIRSPHRQQRSSDGRSLAGLEVDRKVESGRLLDGNIRRLKRVAPNSAGIFWTVRPNLPGHDATVSVRRCDLQ
jgi:hypothetical protein